MSIFQGKVFFLTKKLENKKTKPTLLHQFLKLNTKWFFQIPTFFKHFCSRAGRLLDGGGAPLCTISLDHIVCVKFFVKINIIKFVNSAKSSTVDSTTLARIENKKVIIVVANTTPLLTFSIMYLIFFFIVFFYPKITAQKMDVEPAKWEK